MTATPTLTVAPNPASASALVMVSGAGFPYAKTRLLLDGVSVTASTFRPRAGAFGVGVVVPSAEGTHTLVAEQQSCPSWVEKARASVVVEAAVVPPTDHWSGIPFGSRTLSAPLTFDNATDVEVSGKTFRGSIYPSSALRFAGCHNVWVHDCDFDDLDWDVFDRLDCTGFFHFEWNRVGAFRYVSTGRRPDVGQMVRSATPGYIRNNKIKTGGQNEDIISFVDNSGGLAGDLFEVDHNAIEGGTGAIPSTSGSGTMCADNSDGTHGHIWVHHNTYLNPAQVGVGISGGIDCHVTDNIIYGAQRTGSNVGIYTPYVGGSPNPGGHEVARNRVWWINEAGTPNPYWDGGASGAVSGVSSNVWQDSTIDPTALQVTL